MSMEMDNMNEDQSGILLQFHSVTSIDDLKRCEEILEQHNWDLQEAVDSTMGNTALSAQFSDGEEEQVAEPETFITPMFNETSISSQASFGPKNLSLEARNLVNDVQTPHPSAFERVISILRHLYRRLTGNLLNARDSLVALIFPSCRQPTIEAKSAEDQVEDFIAKFNTKYVSNAPLKFMRETYDAAQSIAKQELKFLLIYLHDPSSKDVDPFCFGTLCHPDTVDFINENVLLWGCSVDRPEGFRVSGELLNETYPFLALQCLQQGRLTVVAKTHDQLTSEELIARLQEVIDLYEPNLKLLRDERVALQLNRIIRQEQEEEYRKSLEIDRKKSRQLEIEREAQQLIEVEKLALKEERRRRRATFVERKLHCGLNLPAEPSPDDSDVITLQIKFASGARVKRRFRTTDSVRVLHDFVYSHEGTPFKLQIVTCFPKREVSCCSTNYIDNCEDEAHPTLNEVGLSRNETLALVNSWDEEESLSASSSTLSVKSHVNV